MKCPNCKYETGRLVLCPNCGMDTVLFSRTCDISNALYNVGLSKAKNGNLSAAKEKLIKSLEFNKCNIDARNLLGLVFYEMGQVGEAIRHFLMSVSIRPEDNMASGYLERFERNARQVEKYNDSLKLYNQALDYIEQKSEDLAIIQLRKAAELNPKNIDAMNLLAFCYLIQKEKDKARVLIDRVLVLDVYNEIAQNYLKEIGISRSSRPEPAQRMNRTMPQPNVSQQTYSRLQVQSQNKKSFGETFHISEILFFVIGGICSFALCFFLLVPASIESRESTIERLKTEKAAVEQELDRTKMDYETKLATIEKENESLKSSNDELGTAMKLQEKIQRALDILNVYNTEDYIKTSELIYNLDTTDLPSDMLEKITQAKEVSYEKAASELYSEGAKEFNAKKYADAKLNFGKALKYAGSDLSFTDDIYYLLALIGELYDNNKEEAIKNYETIISNYPNSNRLAQAKTNLQKLQE